MRYIKTFEARLNNSWKQCGDCGKSNPEDYWFRDWLEYIPKSKQKKFICIKCLEKRVGRELKKSDFEPYTHYYRGQEWFEKLNENLLNESKRELKEFCDINLAYLVDADFDISINTATAGGYVINFSRERGFIWNEITDQFIPFLERLSNDYTLGMTMISFNERFPQSHESKMVNPQSLMNHEIMIDFLGDTLLRKIMIRIQKKT